MLEIRPCYEHCGIDLLHNSTEAMICSFECTFCRDCANIIFQDVCPNCGGGFTRRPIRPLKHLSKYPVSEKRIHNPKNEKETQHLITKYKDIPPEDR